MATVYIPSLMRDLTAGFDTATVRGNTIRQIIAALEVCFPGMKQRLCEDDRLRPGLAVAIDGQLAPLGLEQVVAADSEIHFIPAIGGG